MLKKALITVLLIFAWDAGLFSQQYFFRKYSNEDGLAQASVYCMLQDSRGFIWVGTEGGGLSRFDGYKFETFTKANGLTDNIIRSLCEDRDGKIWIGTDNGLTLYDGLTFRSITEKDGLKGSSVLRIIQ